MTNERFADSIALKFRRAWDRNDYRFSDGKSIEIWLRKSIEDELNTKKLTISKSKAK